MMALKCFLNYKQNYVNVRCFEYCHVLYYLCYVSWTKPASDLWVTKAKQSRLETGESGIKQKFNFKVREVACKQGSRLDTCAGAAPLMRAPTVVLVVLNTFIPMAVQ